MQKLARNGSWALAAIISIAGFFAVAEHLQPRQVQAAPAVQVDKSSIGGVVLNTSGQKPEAGVWVIAETKSLPVPYRKIVVTDDKGQFLVPDLPEGAYEIWVRGYGLQDSARTKGYARAGASLSRRQRQRCSRSGKNLSRQLLDLAGSASLAIGVAEPSTPPRNIGWRHGGRAATSATSWAWLPLAAIRIRKIGTRIFQRNSGMNGMAESLGKPMLEKTLGRMGHAHSGGRSAASPGAPNRHGAQYRRHRVGLGRRRFLHPRPDLNRQAQSHSVSLRKSLWR